MTRRETILLKILIIVFIFSISFFILNGINIEKEIAIESISQYEKMIEKLSSSIETNKSNSKSKQQDTKMEVTELLNLILSDYKEVGIRPIKYQINDKEKNEYVDFILQCKPYQLEKYLQKMKEGFYPYTISSLSIKKLDDTLSVSIKYTKTSTKIVSQNSDAITVQKLFYMKPKNISKEVIRKDQQEIITNGNTKYKIIGNINNTDNKRYLYIKEISGKLIKVPPEDILEEDNNTYILKIDDKKIRLSK